MKRLQTVLPVVLIVLSAFALVTYTACREKLCTDTVCQHEGLCEAGTCLCRFGYVGKVCENLMRDVFIGTWEGDDQCNTGGFPAVLNISAAAPTDMNVMLTLPNGINNSGQQLQVQGSLTAADAITVIPGTSANQYIMHSGVIYLDSTKTGMSFNYAVSDTATLADTIKCIGVYTLQ